MMKRLTTLAIASLLTASLSAQTLQTEKDSASYAMGIVQAMGMERETDDKILLDKFAQGFHDYFLAKDKTLLPIDSAYQTVSKYIYKITAEEEAKAQEMCLANKEFLLKNKEEKGIVTTESGLQYKVIAQGKGARPTENDNVEVHYIGSLIDGTVFDSSVERGEPATFPVQAVIPGFSEALKLMNVGSKYIIYVPSELGYGMRDMGVIKPCSTLIFELELLGIPSGSQTEPATAEKPSKKEKKTKK